jgi:hypothetical protein
MTVVGGEAVFFELVCHQIQIPAPNARTRINGKKLRRRFLRETGMMNFPRRFTGRFSHKSHAAPKLKGNGQKVVIEGRGNCG